MKKYLLGIFIMLLWALPVNAQEAPGLQVGDAAPNFKAMTSENKEAHLASYLKEGPLVLVFYRGGWCPFCNMQLKALQNSLDRFQEKGANILAVSVDLAANSATTAEENQLEFEVISDPIAALLEMYNVVFHVPEELALMYKTKYDIDLEAASGRDDYLIAIPATYIIDTNGKIVYAHVDENYKVRPPVDELLNVLEGLHNDEE